MREKEGWRGWKRRSEQASISNLAGEIVPPIYLVQGRFEERVESYEGVNLRDERLAMAVQKKDVSD
jgi:hypothetical protein